MVVNVTKFPLLVLQWMNVMGLGLPPVSADVSDICTTAGCVEAASHILSTYDPSVDPCEDFYQFTCGKWLEETPIPDDKSSYGAFSQVAERVTTQMRLLLEKDIRLSFDSTAVNMTRRAYRECMNTEKLTMLKSDSIGKILAKLGGIPLLISGWTGDKFDYNKMLAVVKRDYLDDPMFSVGVSVDERNSSRHLIHLDEAGLGLGSRDFYLNDTLYGARIMAYTRYIEEVLNLIAQDAKIKQLPEDMKAQIDGIVDFERILANLTQPPEEKRNASKLYNKYTLAEFKKLVPEIDWDHYFKSFLPKDVLAIFNDETELIVAVPKYYTEIGRLLKEFDPKILSNFFLWSIVSSRVGLMDERFSEVDQQLKKALYGREQKPLRWKKCVGSAQNLLDVAAGAIYVDKHFKVSDKNEVERMVTDLIATMSVMIKDLDWMDSPTKTLALDKVRNIITHLGYPEYVKNATALDEYYKDLTFDDHDGLLEVTVKVAKWANDKNFRDLLKPFDRHKFDENAAIVNAFYNPSTNAIVFPAGILQPPFFKSSYPRYINYGAMGSVIGHEITHGFDDEGSQFDKLGKLENWWTEKAAGAFQERVQCIIDQYSGYEVKDIKRKINGQLTQGENVADNGGLKEAYRAYQKYLNDTGVVEPTLPGLNLTNDQAFFVSFASFWCGKRKPEAALQQILSDPHSPDRFRVFGTLSNTKEFADTFNCKPTATLNPKERCAVW